MGGRPLIDRLCQFWHIGAVVDRTKKLPARFYVKAAGRKPVREWILRLPESDRYVIGKDIQKSNSDGRPGGRIARRWGRGSGKYGARWRGTVSRG
jgi:hypothetical protein